MSDKHQSIRGRESSLYNTHGLRRMYCVRPLVRFVNSGFDLKAVKSNRSKEGKWNFKLNSIARFLVSLTIEDRET